VIEADTVAHCGPTLIGEFARTLTMTDLVTGWTENASVRNNAMTWITAGIEELQAWFPFPMTTFDSDCGSEFINHEVAAWLQARDIAQTRSRPYQKNDQAHVESKNHHVVRKHAFYWRYDTAEQVQLLNRMWRLMSLRLNFFTPTKKPIGYAINADGRKKRLYDKPATPWQRVQSSNIIDAQQLSDIAARIDGINPADSTREINAIQMQLLDLAKAKTEALATARHIDLAALQPSINRLTKTK
jgi:predicted transposase YbfD/YdcC